MKNMSSKVVSGVTPGGKRIILGEVLPLEIPFLIQIFPVYGCNFKCEYCFFCFLEVDVLLVLSLELE